MLALVPWKDRATLTLRLAGQEPRIALKGLLRDTVAAVGAAPASERSHMHIALPERQNSPFEFLPEHFDELIARARWLS